MSTRRGKKARAILCRACLERCFPEAVNAAGICGGCQRDPATAMLRRQQARR